MRRDWVLVLVILLVVLGMSVIGDSGSLAAPNEEGVSYIIDEPSDIGDHPCGRFWYRSFQGTFAHFVQWSPDGTFLIFNHSKAIWKVDAGGTRLQKIADVNSQFRFPYGLYSDLSPDGRRIVYTTCEYAHDTTLEGDNAKRLSYSYEIGVINIDGTGRQRLTENSYVESYPVWSPNGARIAFVAAPRDNVRLLPEWETELFTMKADGSESRLVASMWQNYSTSDVASPPDVTHPPEEWPWALPLAPPVWSQDGERLAFLTTTSRTGKQLYTVRADGLELARLAKNVVSVPAWSPDGRHLAYARYDEDVVALFTLSTDRFDEELIAVITDRNKMYQDSYRNWISTVAWSPDGTRILYTCNGGACIVDLEDGGVLRLRVKQFYWHEPAAAAWSPDGSRVALYDVGSGRSVIVSADGTDVRGLVWLNRGYLRPAKLVPWNAPPIQSNVGISDCRSTSTVPDPEANAGLVQDCETLLGLRDTLAGHGELNWISGISIERWQGVTLGGTPLRVHYLEITNAGLTGTLPPQLGQLAELRGLSVTNIGLDTNPRYPNGLTGVIPPELGNLSKLEQLLLSHNFLSGEIPAELGNLTNLKQLTLNSNYLTGEIPVELSRITDLEVLNLSDNRLHGSIPPELSALGRLQEVSFYGGLYLERNDWSGCVATELPDTWVEASGLERCA